MSPEAESVSKMCASNRQTSQREPRGRRNIGQNPFPRAPSTFLEGVWEGFRGFQILSEEVLGALEIVSIIMVGSPYYAARPHAERYCTKRPQSSTPGMVAGQRRTLQRGVRRESINMSLIFAVVSASCNKSGHQLFLRGGPGTHVQPFCASKTSSPLISGSKYLLRTVSYTHLTLPTKLEV